jgi:single-strand DNA-binding protein
MANFNKVILLGRLTRDPELRYTPSGSAVINLGLAVSSPYKQGDEWKEDTCFIDVVVFGKRAESCNEYLSKGNPVLVEGRLRWRSWEGQDGQKRSKHEVFATNIQFVPRGSGYSQGAKPSQAEDEFLSEEEPPF